MSQSLAASAVPVAREPPGATASTPRRAPSAAHRPATGPGSSISGVVRGGSARADEVPERSRALHHRVHVLGEELPRRDHHLRILAHPREVGLAARVALLDRAPRIAGPRPL